ncbi:UDP-2,3-diacylglucosamine hydrolase [Brumimicrobium salinarum]|uniref:UDP-2,3-diacylglucosamine hydrolase n=1 Tax=Brumimicrobium salinarum TaxID=2058658 RepID=A0A2I0QZN6_9FLAO|nr:UDP-2,3-diacylglucosamine diphosphatase [Brumimicrobium salinarum]PKR79788.1 UDP-2,3-diacylglucosamine hydrolase [Brumimicrobium salinarum]
MSSAKRKIYFASDFHLGVPNFQESLERERLIVQWLDEIKNEAAAIYLVGDIFDFWFEYKNAIPKGFVRLQGKIAELTDAGIPIHFFTGNHDMWMFGYHEEELGIKIHRKPIVVEAQGKKIYIGHGDGLGPGDHGYKFIKKVFSNRFFQWCFARLHPNFGIGIANYFSRSSRAATGNEDDKHLGEENEWLAIYAKEMLKESHYDYFIFGHRHLPLKIHVGKESTYYNLGDWLKYFTYGELEAGEMKLKVYPSNQLYPFDV